MDSVFIVVDKVPEKLTKYEMVLQRPNFMDEIVACERRRGGAHIVGANYLRSIAEEIGRKYDKNFNPYRNVIATDYAGVSCPSLTDVAVLVERMFLASYPKIYESFYEYKVRARPFNIRVVYLVDEARFGTACERAGLKRIQEAEIEDNLGFNKTAYLQKETELAHKSHKEVAETVPLVQGKSLVEEVKKVLVDAPVVEDPIDQSKALEELANLPTSEPEPAPKKSKYKKKNKEAKV